MNQLAHFVYQLINGNRTKRTNLSKTERTALAELRPLLNRDPDELTSLLAQTQVQAENWLITPPRSVVND